MRSYSPIEGGLLLKSKLNVKKNDSNKGDVCFNRGLTEVVRVIA